MLERRDVANKSELGRIAMAAQRLQQNVPSGSAGSLGLADGNARLQGHSGSALTSDSQVLQGNQSGGGIASHDGGNPNGQEPERSATVEGSMHSGSDQPLQQHSSSIEGSQNALRRNGALGLVASAASAFDAAKDIMEALRSKHANLASELEVLLPLKFAYFALRICLSYIVPALKVYIKCNPTVRRYKLPLLLLTS